MSFFAYRIINYSTKQIYFGATTNPVQRIQSHSKGHTKAIRRWKFAPKLSRPHRIYWDVRGRFDSFREASAYAHWLERNTKVPGFINIKTGGK